MKACFIGHQIIEETEELVSSLKRAVVTLINKGGDTFLFGSKSAFDDLCWKLVTELKKEYSYIKRVYVRVNYQEISNTYEEYLLKCYEKTYLPKKIENAGKCSYVERNYEMIDESTYCVFYYNEKYTPPIKRGEKRSSGTKIAYEYAVMKKKEIVNLYR